MRNKETMQRIEDMRIEGKTWREIADMLNNLHGASYDESVYRKYYTAYSDGKKQGVTDVELQEQMVRLDIEKKKLAIRRGTYNEEIRDGALGELFIEEIQNSVSKLKPISVKGTKSLYKFSPEFDIIFLSDLHYDGTFDLEAVFDLLYDKIVDEAMSREMNKLIIVECGDTVEGSSLRPSQMRAIKLGMIDQIVEVSEYYAQLIASLRDTLQIPVEFHMVTESNHTQIRPLNTKRNELPDEDLMKVMYRFLLARFKDVDGVEIHGSGDLNLKYGQVGAFVSHGHKYNVSPNNLNSVVKDIYFYLDEGKNNKKPNFFFFGHFHHYREITLNKEKGIDSKAFLLPALSPIISSYERHGLMGCNPAFAICTFSLDGRHVSTKTIPMNYDFLQ